MMGQILGRLHNQTEVTANKQYDILSARVVTVSLGNN
jgi:hypothetical protein